MGKLLGTRNGSPYPLVTRGKRALSSERHEECAALGGLARMLMLLEIKNKRVPAALSHWHPLELLNF
jgi:hypothetical protein